jgi:hypothetical protein
VPIVIRHQSAVQIVPKLAPGSLKTGSSAPGPSRRFR